MSDEWRSTSEETTKQFIALAEAANLSGLSHAHLRRMAIAGKLWATKIGRDWLTTEDAVKAYLATDRKPGPKPKN